MNERLLFYISPVVAGVVGAINIFSILHGAKNDQLNEQELVKLAKIDSELAEIIANSHAEPVDSARLNPQIDTIFTRQGSTAPPRVIERRTMEIYSQRDPRWAAKTFSDENLTMAHFGCLVTAVAQALTIAGYEVDPGTLCDQLNANGGFTNHDYPQGSGLIIWSKVSELYPQFHYGEGGYTFQKGMWGKFQHFVLKHESGVYDPFYGADHEPAGFVEVPGSRSAAIDPKPAPEPEVVYNDYTVQEGDNLGHIIATHYNLNTWGEIAERIPQVVADNGLQSANHIEVGQVLKLRA